MDVLYFTLEILLLIRILSLPGIREVPAYKFLWFFRLNPSLTYIGKLFIHPLQYFFRVVLYFPLFLSIFILNILTKCNFREVILLYRDKHKKKIFSFCFIYKSLVLVLRVLFLFCFRGNSRQKQNKQKKLKLSKRLINN